MGIEKIGFINNNHFQMPAFLLKYRLVEHRPKFKKNQRPFCMIYLVYLYIYISTEDENSETTVGNLNCIFPYIYDSLQR